MESNRPGGTGSPNTQTFSEVQISHPNSAIERLYLSRNRGRRDLFSVKQMYDNEVLNLIKYFGEQKNDLILQVIKHDKKCYTFKIKPKHETKRLTDFNRDN